MEGVLRRGRRHVQRRDVRVRAVAHERAGVDAVRRAGAVGAGDVCGWRRGRRWRWWWRWRRRRWWKRWGRQRGRREGGGGQRGRGGRGGGGWEGWGLRGRRRNG